MKGQTVKTQDRVSFSLSRSIGLPGYNNHYNIFISYGSDISEGEDLNKAFLRVERKTVREFERVMAWVEGGKIKGMEGKK